MFKFIDTHAHLSDGAYAPEEIEGVIERAAAAGVGVILHPDIDSRERRRTFEICRAHPGVVLPMLGLYPGSVTDDWEKELELMTPYKDEDIVAIGEIGLDYHWSREFAVQQKEALKVQLEMASAMDLPVNIHLRDATDDFFEVLASCRHLSLRGNLHAFSGSYQTYCRLQDFGDFRVGIGGVVTYKNSHLPDAVARIPLDRIILETDAPYLPPTPHRGERNEPSMIPLIAEKIALVKGVDIEEVAATTTAAAMSLFNLSLKTAEKHE